MTDLHYCVVLRVQRWRNEYHVRQYKDTLRSAAHAQASQALHSLRSTLQRRMTACSAFPFVCARVCRQALRANCRPLSGTAPHM